MSAADVSRIAVLDANDGLHKGLRRRYGLAPSSNGVAASDVAYVGREFRVYTFMRIDEASRFGVLALFKINASELASNLFSVDGAILWRNAAVDLLVGAAIAVAGLLAALREVDRRRAT